MQNITPISITYPATSPSYTNLDGLILDEEDLKRYNGHLLIEQLQLREGEDQPTITPLPPNTTAHSINQWLRPTNISEDDVDRWKATPALRILMIKTKNEFSRNPGHNPKHRTIPGQTEVKPLADHEKHIELVKDIFQHARLSLAALGSYIKANISFSSSVPYEVFDDKGTCSGDVSSHFCSGTSWSIAWSYFHETRHTAAVMFYREGDGEHRRNELVQEIIRLRNHIAHPMLLAYAKTQISLQWTFHLLAQMNGQTFQIEKSVGLATWDWVLDREIKAYPDPDENPDAELDVARRQKEAVERYNVLVGKLINIRFRFRSFGEQIMWLRRSNDAYLASLKGGKSLEARKRECVELNAMLDRMDDFRKNYLHDAETLYDRLRQQMSSMFYVITQRDSRISLAIADINNELAWHGKNTNSAMMAIAVASFIFLPSTFIASVFDAPIFNFPAPSPDSPIIAEPFWIFWTSCGLTSLGLCLIWYIFMKVRNAAAKVRRKDARHEFRQRIMRAPTFNVRAKRGPAAENEADDRKWWQLWNDRVKDADEEHGIGAYRAVSFEKDCNLARPVSAYCL